MLIPLQSTYLFRRQTAKTWVAVINAGGYQNGHQNNNDDNNQKNWQQQQTKTKKQKEEKIKDEANE